MATASTTPATIRAKMQTLLLALTPLTHADRGFRLYPGTEVFELWVAENVASSFRHFTIREIDAGEEPEVSDLVVESRWALVELLIAYPKQWGLYGDERIHAAEALIQEDRRLIDGRSGVGAKNSSACVSGQHYARREAAETLGLDDDLEFMVSRLTYRLGFYQAVAA